MAVEVGRLVAFLGLDTSQFERGLTASGARLRQHSAVVHSSTRQSAQALTSWQRTAFDASRSYNTLAGSTQHLAMTTGRLGAPLASTTRQLGHMHSAAAVAATRVAPLNTGVGRLGRSMGGASVNAAMLSGRLSTVANVLAPTSASAWQAGAAFGGGATAAGFGGAALAFGMFKAGQAAIQFESDFAGVRKTVEGSPAELAAISDELRRMSTQAPTTTAQLAAIAEAAGQLGIETGSVTDFTRVIAQLNDTTNLAGEQGATALARLANITQMPQRNFDRLGSTIVALGNNLATTEAEIADFALRVAGAGTQVGLTEDEILAVAGAMSSLGIESEAGGTAISRTLINIEQAVDAGGAKLQRFAEISGMSASEFAALWRDDAAAALEAFTGGLGQVEDAGGSLFDTLEELGLSEIRVRDALLRLANGEGVLAAALDVSSDAWRENTALADEAQKRYETTAAQLAVAGNNVKDMALAVGNNLLPAIRGAVGGFNDLVAGVRGFDNTITDESGLGRYLRTVGDLSARFVPFVNLLRDTTDATRAQTAADADAARFAGRYSDEMAVLTGRVDDAAGPLEDIGDAAGFTAEQLENLTDAQKAVNSAIAGFVDPLRVYQDVLAEKEAAERASAEETARSTKSSKDSWEDYADDVDVSLREVADALESQLEAQANWERNLTVVAARTSGEVAGLLAEMGEDGVELVAAMADGSTAQVRRMERLILRDMESGSDDQVLALEQRFDAMGGIVKRGGKAVVDAMGNELQVGTRVVERIVKDYARALAAGLNPVILSVGGRPVVVSSVRDLSPRAIDRVLTGRADGGIDFGRPSAHITNVPRVLYGEPETAGEAFIPLASNKRQRSRMIAEETVRRLGGVARFADGGFHSAGQVPRVPASQTPPGAVGDTGDLAMRRTREQVVAWLKRNAPALGFAGAPEGGGIVAVGRWLQSLGFHVGEHDAFGGVAPVHSPRSYHYRNRALDVNWRGSGSETAKLNALAGALRRRFGNRILELFYPGHDPVGGHSGHLHLAMALGGILGGPGGVRYGRFDSGGVIPPGLNLVDNRTGRTETIVTDRERKLEARLERLADALAKLERTIDRRGISEQRSDLRRDIRRARRGVGRAERAVDDAEGRRERRAAERDLRDAERERRQARRAAAEFNRDQREDRRIDRLRRQSDAVEDAIDVEREYTRWLQERADDLRDVARGTLDDLNRMIDEHQRLSDQRVDVERRHQERVTELQAAHQQRRRDLSEQHERAVTDILARRRDELARWLALDERPGGGVAAGRDDLSGLLAQLVDAGLSESTVDLMAGVGGTAGLVEGIEAQTAAMREWRDGLAQLRARGVSEGVFGGFGLDSSPVMLDQVRRLVASTDEELARLNEVVAARNREVDARVAEEQRFRLGAVGEQLAEAHATYQEGLTAAREQFNDDMAAAGEDLAGQLAALDEELAAIGADTGRNWSEAIAEGIRSRLPAILEQVAAVRRALAAVDREADTAAKVKRIFDKAGVSLAKGARPGESPTDRLERIVGEVTSGGRSLSDVRKSVKRLAGLHAGGIVTEPTLAMLAERSRPEAVIPLPAGWERSLGRSVTGDGGVSFAPTYQIDARGSGPGVEAEIRRVLDEHAAVQYRELVAMGVGG